MIIYDFDKRLQETLVRMFMQVPNGVRHNGLIWQAVIQEGGEAWAEYGPIPPAMRADDV